MSTTISEILRRRKVHDLLLVLILIFLGVASFGLGRLSVPKQGSVPVTLCVNSNGNTPETDISTREEQAANVITSLPIPEEQYVGSKNGTVYHLPWCSGAKRISEENKVWFTTKEEAEQAGYRKAANCKGL